MESVPPTYHPPKQPGTAVETPRRAEPRLPVDGPNLVLIGYMGTGKSSVGRLIAKFGRMTFLDTDELIVAKAGRTIPEIFAAEGMEHFRRLETEVLRDLRGTRGAVIATGGGIVTRPENTPLLRELGIIVWLTAEEPVIFERVSRNRNRPMLHTENPRETVRLLLEERTPLYRGLGEIVADTSWLSQGDVAHAILTEVHRRVSSTCQVDGSGLT